MELTGTYTEKGRALLAKLLCGGPLDITRAEAGAGTTAMPAAALDQPRQALALLSPLREGNTAMLPVTLAAYQARTAYMLTEVGIYARDPEEGEILHRVYRLDAPVEVSPASRTVLRFYLAETVSGETAVTAPVSPAGVVLAADFTPVREAVFATSAPEQNVTLAAQDLQAYIDALPRLLTKKYTVRVSGEWAGTLLIRGFYGPGFLRIMSDTPGGCVLTGRAHILECACLIQLENLELRASNDLTTHNHFILGLEGAARANLLYLRITGNGACAGLNVSSQSHCYFADGSISHCSMATQIVGSSVLTVNVVPAEVAARWTGNGCGAYVFWGGAALLASSAPELLGGSYNGKNGGLIARADGTLL